jgi:hypothetical protein
MSEKVDQLVPRKEMMWEKLGYHLVGRLGFVTVDKTAEKMAHHLVALKELTGTLSAVPMAHWLGLEKENLKV